LAYNPELEIRMKSNSSPGRQTDIFITQESPMTEFKVAGMSCQHCVKAITHSIQALDAQACVEVDLAAGRVKVESTQDIIALKAAINDAGYTVQII
jgi:copper chaperone